MAGVRYLRAGGTLGGPFTYPRILGYLRHHLYFKCGLLDIKDPGRPTKEDFPD
jgi:hypothetical protein